MPSASNEIVINRPVADVYGFLANAENDAKWRPGVVDIRREGGGAPGVGTRYRQGVKGPFGRRIPADVEITEFRPDELIAFRALKGPVRPEGRYELTPSGTGTQVRFSLRAGLTGVKKLMAPMVQKTMDGEVAGLERLKRVLGSEGAL